MQPCRNCPNANSFTCCAGNVPFVDDATIIKEPSDYVWSANMEPGKETIVTPDFRIVIQWTVAEQRKLVQAEMDESCFRMWLTKDEAARADFADWTKYELVDGRVAVWRKESDLDKLQAGGEIALWRAISERRLADDVT